MFRVVSHGQLLATDADGQTLASHDLFDDPDGILLAQVPIQSVTTLYPRIGDALARICQVFVLLEVITLISGRLRQRNQENVDLQNSTRRTTHVGVRPELNPNQV